MSKWKNTSRAIVKKRRYMREFGLFMKARANAQNKGKYINGSNHIPPVKINQDHHGGDACHWIVSFSIEIGLLPNLKCEVIKCSDCDSIGCYWEHRDYNEPLDIVPICKKCNYLRGAAIYVRNDRRKFLKDAVREFQLAANGRKSKFEYYLSGMTLQYRAELLTCLKNQPSDLSYGGDNVTKPIENSLNGPEQFTGTKTLDSRARQR